MLRAWPLFSVRTGPLFRDLVWCNSFEKEFPDRDNSVLAHNIGGKTSCVPEAEGTQALSKSASRDLIHYMGCDSFLRYPHTPMGESAVEVSVKAEVNRQIFPVQYYIDGK